MDASYKSKYIQDKKNTDNGHQFDGIPIYYRNFQYVRIGSFRWFVSITTQQQQP